MLYQRDGHLTRDLLRTPGGFGLGQVPARRKPDATTDVVCGYCSTGCSLTVHLRDGAAVGLTPAADYPVNRGVACPKGWEALTVLEADDRATAPLRRDAGGVRRPVSWDEALRTMVERFRTIQAAHGPEAVAFLSTGQMATEEMALLGALAKFGMGMAHGDGNTRQCMATSVVAYKQAFGFDAPPYTYRDFEESDVIVFVGANPCLAHPILWERVLRNPHDPTVVVIDPRVTETAMQATRHLPLRPKSDQALFYGLARLLIERGWIDRAYVDAHTRDFDAYAAAVEPFTLERTSEATGLGPGAIERLAETIHGGRRVSFWWTMGVNQSYQGVRTAQAVINLALMTGNIGRPGTGANSITGQCNAMGSRLFSNTTNLLGGHDFADPGHREKVARILDIDPARIPRRPSLAYSEILEGILQGRIRGLWVVCTNTAHSWINQDQARDILGRLDCLVVQDMYATTETARMADVVLPAAGWGEKEGTFINSERRIGTIKRVARAPGQALADFAIFKLGRGVLGLRRHVPRLGVAGRDVPDPEAALGGPALRHHRHRRLRHAGRARRHPVALPGRRCGGGRAHGAPPLRGRPLLPPGRTGPLSVRSAAPAPRAAHQALSAAAPDRPRQRRAVAHRDPHRQVGGAPQAPSRAGLRGDQPARRQDPRRRHQRHRPRRVAPRPHRRRRVRHPLGAAGSGLHPDALRGDQPPHRRRLRSLLEAAVVQGLRRRAAPRRRGRVSRAEVETAGTGSAARSRPAPAQSHPHAVH